jgi:hypothetical protein
MTIHLARFMEGSLPVESSPLPVWNQLIELSGTQNFFTGEPRSADRIIFIDLHQAHHLDVRRTIVRHPFFTEHRNKILVWNETDRPIFDVRGLYVNVPQALIQEHSVAPIPYLFVPADSLFHGTNFSKHYRTVTCTYRGTNTHKCRNVLTKINQPHYSLVDSTKSNHITTSEYLSELDHSLHALCPRGHGLTSFRLYEAMARGCLPIIVADGWVPPKGINWDQFCTFVKESDLEYLPNHVNYSDIDVSIRQESLRKEFSAFLAPNARMNYFLQQISDVPHGDCISLSYTAKLHNMNLKIRQKVMTLKRLTLGQ